MKIVRIDSLHSGDYKSCNANGTGFRIIIWCSGCDINCPGCHNNEYWGFDKGREFTEDDLKFIIEELSNYMYDGVTLIGGEPTAPQNYGDMTKIAEAVKSVYKDTKTVWTYSGRTLDNLEKNPDLKALLDNTDVLVDGPYVEKLRNIGLVFRGSTNQVIWEKKDGVFVKSSLN